MPYELPIYDLDLRRRERAEGKPAEKLAAWIEAHLTPLAGEANPSPRSIHQAVVRLTWQFYYATRGAAEAERETLVTACLAALDTLHDKWLDIEKIDLVEERIIRDPAPPRHGESVPTLPRDPEQIELHFPFSPEDV
jgi:hypothetical protein